MVPIDSSGAYTLWDIRVNKKNTHRSVYKLCARARGLFVFFSCINNQRFRENLTTPTARARVAFGLQLRRSTRTVINPREILFPNKLRRGVVPVRSIYQRVRVLQDANV